MIPRWSSESPTRSGIAPARTSSSTFTGACSTYFDAEVTELDFADPAAADVINAWVSARTTGRIDEIVAKPINPDFVMFLINAIYFKGAWTYQFDPALTRDDEFTGPDGTRETLQDDGSSPSPARPANSSTSATTPWRRSTCLTPTAGSR